MIPDSNSIKFETACSKTVSQLLKFYFIICQNPSPRHILLIKNIKMEADIMNEEQISQTLLDQMVSSDRGQMIKAAIPYLPPKGQQIFSVYEKAVEFINTVSVFSKRSSGSDLCAMSMPPQNPVDIINDIRSFCYGPSRDKLNQMVNMMAMVQMLQLMNQPADGEKEDSHE